MCRSCNDRRSQPFDDAWTTLIRFVLSAEEAVLRARKIHLKEVYGEDWEKRGLDLIRFFVKQICCVIAEKADSEIPDELIAFLDGGSEPDSLRLQLAVDENAWQFTRWLRVSPSEADQGGGLIFMGSNTVSKDPGSTVVVNIYGWYMVRWMCVLWEYDATRDFPSTFDSPWVDLDTVHLALGKDPRVAEKFEAAVRAVESGEEPREDEDVDEFLRRLNPHS